MVKQTLASALSLSIAMCGCVDTRTTDTARSAVEQLLLSTAADRAVADADLSSLKGTTAYVDTTHFEATDKGYVIVALRDSLGATGALLAPDQKAAEAVVEVGSGALALDRSDFLFGIPSIPIPIPGIGMFKTPEISLFKTISQKGVAKLRLFAREQKSGKQLLSTGPKAGRSYYTRWQILLVSFKTTDVPEKKTVRKLPF